MRRTRVRQVAAGALAVAVVLSVWVPVAAQGSHEEGGATHAVSVDVYEVRAGDTLWGIARALVGPAGDPRPVVDRIARANGIEAGDLQVGQRLVLPMPGR